jgi:hypothetical protein
MKHLSNYLKSLENVVVVNEFDDMKKDFFFKYNELLTLISEKCDKKIYHHEDLDENKIYSIDHIKIKMDYLMENNRNNSMKNIQTFFAFFKFFLFLLFLFELRQRNTSKPKEHQTYFNKNLVRDTLLLTEK